MKARRRRPPSELSKTQDEFLLEVIGEVVLGAEEDDTSLRNCVFTVLSAGACLKVVRERD